jgi:DNA primase
MLDLMRWSAEQYHRCLLDSPLAEPARRYLGERQLTGDTLRRFGLGFAPATGDWLTQRAAQAGMAMDLLEKVGLIAARNEGEGYYDRFRDRVMFPIRDSRGQPVGFGGRILPNSPSAERAPKYYNSSDTPLFNKSEHLYGLDQARQAGAQAGYLAVVEGYTDVLMAQQMGIANVVSTMGTALNARHVQHLRRFVPRVVLVFDADAGGSKGADRALTIFVSQNVDLALATLPEGFDPCDLLVRQGAEPFRAVLENAVDALEFKLNQLLAVEATTGIEGRRRALEQILKVIAMAPDMPGQDAAIKRQLIVTRLAQRLALKEETIWARLKELRAAERSREERHGETLSLAQKDGAIAGAPAAPEERELLEILLADPDLVPVAATGVQPEQLRHPGLRQLLEGLYTLRMEGKVPTFDLLRERIDNPHLAAEALEMQERGRSSPDRADWLRQILAVFCRKHRLEPQQQELKNQLHAANDHATALDLLRRLQTQS